MLTRSMLYHRKPLFYFFVALLAAAIAAGVWLLTRPPVQNAENPAVDLSYPLTIISGQNEVKVPGYVAWYENKKDGFSGDGVQISPEDVDDIQYLTLDPDREGPSPFTPYAGDKEVYGQYRLYDESFTEIEFFTPSGLAPQTYLFHGFEPGRYIVSLETSFENKESIVGYQYYFGVIVTKQDKVVTAPAGPTTQTETMTLELFKDGKPVQRIAIQDPEEEQVVRNAIYNGMIKSAAWEGVDIDSQEDRIVIRNAYDTEFYVFDLAGHHCMQSGRDGRYVGINDEAYTSLYSLFSD